MLRIVPKRVACKINIVILFITDLYNILYILVNYMYSLLLIHSDMGYV